MMLGHSDFVTLAGLALIGAFSAIGIAVTFDWIGQALEALEKDKAK
jgi:hypothetical protein